MKSIFTMLAVTTAVLAISPASARAYDNYAGTMEAQTQIKLQIEHGIDNRVISRREAESLYVGLADLNERDTRYGRNGFTRAERADLTRRSDVLRGQVELAQRTDGQYDHDARMDRRNGQTGAYRGHWDNRAVGNPGDWNAGASDNRANAGGVLARDNRGDRFDGDFRVGQPGTAELVALPMEYRPHYQDSQSAYYRYNQGRIYQIDRNSNLILRMLDPAG